jgi:endoglucanase
MKKESLEFLRDMLNTPSPSGYEMGIQGLIRARMKAHCDEIRTDVHGNVITVLNPDAPFRVMLAGHCDECGYMIVHIDDKGFAYFTCVGGTDPVIAIGQRVRIHGRKGPILGVIGRKPIHLTEMEDRGKPSKFHELWIDIGAKDLKDAEKRIAVGDYATIDMGFDELPNNLVVARAFDDRAGAFVMAETMRRLKGRALKVGVYGVATVQEEIGLRGASTSAYSVNPHVGIAIDVGFASDCPGHDSRRIGVCHLGKGPQLHRGPNINPILGDRMEETARKAGIPIQIGAEPRATPTDANVIQLSRGGVAAALLSIPTRYIHSPVEILSLEDLDNSSRLLAAFIEGLNGDEDFTPRQRKAD